MRTGYQLRFEGADELKLALLKRANLEAVKTVVRHSGAQLQIKAMTAAPVDTGNLRRSIALEMEDGGLTADVKAGAHYAAYLEWGTRKMTARPYMGPAFKIQKGIFLAELSRLMR